MAHIEIHDTLPDHPKVVQLARLMRKDRTVVIGHLIVLWLWAIRYRPGGDLCGISDESLCEASGFSVRAVQWPRALRETGFLDGEPGSSSIHNWTQYTRLYRKAHADRTRIAQKRESNVARLSHDRSATVAVTRSEQIRPDPIRTADADESDGIEALVSEARMAGCPDKTDTITNTIRAGLLAGVTRDALSRAMAEHRGRHAWEWVDRLKKPLGKPAACNDLSGILWTPEGQNGK